MIRRCALSLLVVALVACSRETAFHSPDGGRFIVCKGDGYRACREAAEKAGYVEGPPTIRMVAPPAGGQ